MGAGKHNFTYDLDDVENMSEMGKALSSSIRLQILQLLIEQSMTMSQLSQKLFVSLFSVSMHVKILQDVGLVEVIPKPGMHGAQKLCGIRAERVTFDFFENRKNLTKARPSKIVEIPVGCYARAEIQAPCGLVNQEDYIDVEDTQFGFYDTRHVTAQLIWFTTGYLEYDISNRYLHADSLSAVNLSFEVCAEAPGYNNTWPSDIDVKINGVTVTTFRVAGDYGGTRGINNPTWWSDSNTQFGEMKKLSITESGCFLDGRKVSKETINSLKVKENHHFTFAIGVNPDSEYPGGMNLFGKHFGNYKQDIRMEIKY